MLVPEGVLSSEQEMARGSLTAGIGQSIGRCGSPGRAEASGLTALRPGEG